MAGHCGDLALSQPTAGTQKARHSGPRRGEPHHGAAIWRNWANPVSGNRTCHHRRFHLPAHLWLTIETENPRRTYTGWSIVPTPENDFVEFSFDFGSASSSPRYAVKMFSRSVSSRNPKPILQHAAMRLCEVIQAAVRGQNLMMHFSAAWTCPNRSFRSVSPKVEPGIVQKHLSMELFELGLCWRSSRRLMDWSRPRRPECFETCSTWMAGCGFALPNPHLLH